MPSVVCKTLKDLSKILESKPQKDLEVDISKFKIRSSDAKNILSYLSQYNDLNVKFIYNEVMCPKAFAIVLDYMQNLGKEVQDPKVRLDDIEALLEGDGAGLAMSFIRHNPDMKLYFGDNLVGLDVAYCEKSC